MSEAFKPEQPVVTPEDATNLFSRNIRAKASAAFHIIYLLGVLNALFKPKTQTIIVIKR